MSESSLQPLSDHIAQLRQGLIRCLWVFAFAAAVGLLFADSIFQILKLPLTNALPPSATIVALHPIETWLVYLKVGLFSGLILTIPFGIYEAWRFVVPGLQTEEKRWILPLGIGTGMCFIVGAGFGYFVVLPLCLKTLVAWMPTDIMLLPTVEHTFSFMSQMLLAFGIIFEVPVVVFVLAITGIIPFRRLVAFQQYVILLALIVGAVLTPPDPISQVLMAIPIVILYEIGLAAAWLARRVHIPRLVAP